MTVSTYAPQTALSVSTTELSLISGTSSLQNDNTPGAYQLSIDASNMAKGDEFVIRAYKAARSGGTKRVFFQAVLSDAQSQLFVMPAVLMLYNWDFTIQRTAGADRTFDTSIDRAS